MKQLSTLKREAGGAASFRGHRLGRWHSNNAHTALALCASSVCDAWVQVTTRPPANGINIGGPAVAVSCKRA